MRPLAGPCTFDGAFTRITLTDCYHVAAVSSTFNVYSLCWPSHLDPYLHMNNSRYLREMDFGRYDFYVRTGLAKQFPDVLNACLVRYRRAISVFTIFKVMHIAYVLLLTT